MRASQFFRHYPLCHSRPDRSLSYRGRYFGLCARCTSLYIFGFITIFTFTIWSGYITGAGAITLGLVCLFPGGIDGLSQMFGERESTNVLRLVTGALLGIGAPIVIWGVLGLLL